MSLTKLQLIALSCAAAETFLRIPPDYPNPIVLQLYHPQSEALPPLLPEHFVDVAYGDAVGLEPGPDGPGGEPGGEANYNNWGPFHTFAKLAPYGHGDGPRIAVPPGAYVRIRKPSTPFAYGVNATGFTSQGNMSD